MYLTLRRLRQLLIHIGQPIRVAPSKSKFTVDDDSIHKPSLRSFSFVDTFEDLTQRGTQPRNKEDKDRNNAYYALLSRHSYLSDTLALYLL